MPAVGAATSWLYDSPVVEPLRLRRVPLLTACACFALGDLLALRWQPTLLLAAATLLLFALSLISLRRAPASPSFPSTPSGSPSAAGAPRSSPPSPNNPRSIISPTASPATSRAPSSASARFLRRPATPSPRLRTRRLGDRPRPRHAVHRHRRPVRRIPHARPLHHAAHRRRHPLHRQRRRLSPRTAATSSTSRSASAPPTSTAIPAHGPTPTTSSKTASAPPAAPNPRASKSSARGAAQTTQAPRSAAASSPRKPGPPTACSPSPPPPPSAISHPRSASRPKTPPCSTPCSSATAPTSPTPCAKPSSAPEPSTSSSSPACTSHCSPAASSGSCAACAFRKPSPCSSPSCVAFAYAELTGFGIPAQRALIMTAIYLIARWLDREITALNALGAAAARRPRPRPPLPLRSQLPDDLHGHPRHRRPRHPPQRTPHRSHTCAPSATSTSSAPTPPFLPRSRSSASTLRMLTDLSADLLTPRLANLPVWLLRAFFWTCEALLISLTAELCMVLPMAIYFHRATLLALPLNFIDIPLLSVLLCVAIITFLASLVSAWLATHPRRHHRSPAPPHALHRRPRAEPNHRQPPHPRARPHRPRTRLRVHRSTAAGPSERIAALSSPPESSPLCSSRSPSSIPPRPTCIPASSKSPPST